MQNNFIIAINIRCEPEEFIEMLNKCKINYFNLKVEHPKIYYDEQTYILIEVKENRQEFVQKLNSNGDILRNINEYMFCDKE